MSDSLMIKNASDDDDDAYVITNLAREWGARLPYLAELKLFKALIRTLPQCTS